MIISDKNTGLPLLKYELPAAYKTEAEMQIRQFNLAQRIIVRMRAEKQDSFIYYETGENYLYEKLKQYPYDRTQFNQAPSPYSNDGYRLASPCSLQDNLDLFASAILKKQVKTTAFYEPSETLMTALKKGFDEMANSFVLEARNSTTLTMIPVGTVIRNYLLDGGMNIYEDGDHYLALYISRFGIEYESVNGMNGVQEMLSNEPFGQAAPLTGAVIANCTWSIPAICYLISSKKEDLKDFMTYLDSLEITDELNNYNMQLQQQVMLNKQNFFNNAFAQQMQGWAASDRLGQSLSQDLDNFHNSLNQTMAHNDQRFWNDQTNESSDERIQRMRHESMMGVDTYERNDGSTVEYSNYADRVFENNLDSTQHFGTHHYYDDYVPEGWHEMKKK